jgi:hypothetical protein
VCFPLCSSVPSVVKGLKEFERTTGNWSSATIV